MKHLRGGLLRLAVLALILGAWAGCRAALAMDAAEARTVASGLLERDDVRRGICVHVGCGEGALTAELLRGGMQIVQGVDADPAAVAAARRHIETAGRYGPVSVFCGSLARLPYPDNLMNVLVVDRLQEAMAAGFTVGEGLRVLAPYGTAFLGGLPEAGLREALAGAGVADAKLIEVSGQAWAMAVKPYPEEMDEWPQYLHDAGHTRISQDAAVGPATGFRWIQGGFWSASSHPLQAIASAGGRNFYVKAPERGAETYVLEVRDAFNGLLLWERLIWAEPRKSAWFSNRNSDVIALGDRVFTYLEQGGPLTALDAATGRVVAGYEPGGGLNYCDGLLIVRRGSGTWAVVDPESGSTLRAFTVRASYYDSPLLVSDGKAIVLEAGAGEVDSAYGEGRPDAWWQAVKEGERPARGDLVCFDFETGQALWRAPNVGDGRLYWCRRGLLMTRAGDDMHAFSTEGGRHLWSHLMTTKKGGFTAAFYLGDRVWGYGDARWYYAYDPMTGELIQGDPGRWKDFGRCGPDAATERYILGQDLSVYDMQEIATYNCVFSRSDCGTNYIPANGLFYQYGNVCVCMPYCPGVHGISCVPLVPVEEMRARAGEPFERGPAFGRVAEPMPSAASIWPMHRHDAARSGATEATVPAQLAPLWKAALGAPLSAPVVVGGAVYVARVDRHCVTALDAGTGGVRWDYTTGARVDSPPTFHKGLLLFGSRDGWVYCLRASDGELVWRRRAAPEDRMISVRGQLESLWPVFGSVLVEGGVAYFTAGRHGDADGGVFFHAVEPATGKVLWQEDLRGFPPYRSDPHRIMIESRKLVGDGRAFNEETIASAPPELLSGIPLSFTNDLPISDGRTLFVGAVGIDIAERRAYGAPTGQALYAPANTLLNDNSEPTYSGRNQWYYTGDPDEQAWRHYDRNVTSGHLLAIAPTQAFGTQQGARLFAKALERPGRSWRRTEDDARDLRVKALVAAGERLFAACRRRLGDSDEEVGEVRVYSVEDGRRLAENPLGGLPAFDAMAATDGRLFVSTEAGDLVCMGPFFHLVEQDRTFAGGTTVRRTVEFSREASPDYPFEIAWELRVGDAAVRQGVKAFNGPHDVSGGMEIALDVPAVAERTPGRFEVALRRSGQEVFRDVALLDVIDADAGPLPRVAASDLCVWDPSGAVGQRLRARGVAFTEVARFDALPRKTAILVVGKDALTDREKGAEKWLELASGGTRILFLDQQAPVEAGLAGADYGVWEKSAPRAIVRAPAHPCFDGLIQADFDRWPGDGVVCRRVLTRRAVEFRSLADTGSEGESCLAELPAGKGLMLACQLDVGAGLAGNPVAQRLFDNMLDYCVNFRAHSAAFVLAKEGPAAGLAQGSGLVHDPVEDVKAAISGGQYDVVVADASPLNLDKLSSEPDALRAFAEPGGWLMLCGLTPDGLAEFNRIVGVDHLLRPYEIERVSLADEPDPLTAGLSSADLDVTAEDGYGYSGTRWPDAEAYGYVVDCGDIAPFCTFPPPEHWGCAGEPKSDRWPRNMVNGFWDFWKATFVFNLDLGAPTGWTMELPRQERVIGFSVVPDPGYGNVRAMRLSFDTPGAEPVTLELPPEAGRGDIEFAPRAARKVTVEITEWDAAIAASVLGVDNLWLRVERPAGFHERVRPLASIGVLVKYPMGRGGIILNQMRVRSAEEADRLVKAAGGAASAAAGENAEKARGDAEKKLRRHLDGNVAKQRRVFQRILWNLGARSG